MELDCNGKQEQDPTQRPTFPNRFATTRARIEKGFVHYSFRNDLKYNNIKLKSGLIPANKEGEDSKLVWKNS